MKLIITGATGYIGTQLRIAAKLRGIEAISLCRKQGALRIAEWMQYDLANSTEVNIPVDADVVVHLAISKAVISETECTNEIAAACALLGSAQSTGAKFIFVSSQTASENAPTPYGRIKWEIERYVLAAGGWVVRPGQVYGGDEKGLFGTLISTVRTLPLIPAFLPAPKVQPVHINDLVEALLVLVERRDIEPGIFHVGATQPISFTYFLSLIASERLRVRRWFIPVPSWIILVIADVLGKRRSPLLGMERLASLFALPTMETTKDMDILGIRLRPLVFGMRRSCLPLERLNRRCLVREGRMILAYVLKTRANFGVLSRYVRAIEKLRGGVALELPSFFFRMPMAIVLLDDQKYMGTPGGKEFLWRLDAATMLAEATQIGALRYIGLGAQSGAVPYCIILIRAVMMELVCRAASYIWLNRYLRAEVDGTKK
ncbi:sugar nucleotide-binding protein [Herbaspirillum sp. RTI4]|uniref:sugar nucleotide-binding protein n=1 Tax=Herbaspirillum sp. RTI4 TaxID=3048640 RepID=UPI002AB454F9|nr:sugar nucleotide-binding protein [Herbaspirillum sp. RTI4]MDY7577613.1 sugar nucleotide-binding protein [Herbaspirillum sp. RTI4]MEA9983284.1 sugar nucleotide-binding protein [Herbaspirillum sp. RTI4]